MENLEYFPGICTDDSNSPETVRSVYVQIHRHIDQLHSIITTQSTSYPHQLHLENQRVASRLQHLEQGFSVPFQDTGNVLNQFGASPYTESEYDDMVFNLSLCCQESNAIFRKTATIQSHASISILQR